MGWRSEVLLGRLRDQATVLATVTLVTFVATTLLGTFAFLLHVTGDSALRAALERRPESALTVEASVRVTTKDAGPAVDAARTALAATLGDVPSEEALWLTGRMWWLPAGEVAGTPPLAYPASTPAVLEHADLVTGTWPSEARDDAGRLQVNAPHAAAQRFGWSTGTEVPVRTAGGQTEDTWVVVGTHELTGGGDQWSRDLLRGAGHVDDYPLPGSMGRITTEAWGPMVVAPAALLGPSVTETANLLVTPDLSTATPGTLAAMRTALDSAQVELTGALKGAKVSGLVQTRLGGTIDAASRELAVTRIGVVVVGLLLVVLATTVMLLAARLLSERRATEGALLAARGAAPAQLRSLAVLEAVVVAALTAAVAPLVARVVFERVVTGGALGSAGVQPPPGVPAGVWLACGAVAVVLAVALVVPSWHTSGSSSAAPHAALVRAGADLAVVALAAVALWQLIDYGAPLTQGASGARLDPVLVAGPALVALGAALLALRLVGPVAHGADALARRSRSLVAPLAAWQVSRRTAAATGTTLVVVLAVTAATFSHAFLATWRESQLEQVDLALGTDARIGAMRAERLTASADVRAALDGAAPGTRLQPVVDRGATIGRQTGLDGIRSSSEARLLAVDTTDAEALRGRSDPSWAALLDGLDPRPPGDREASGVALPGDPQWIVAALTPGTEPAAAGLVTLRVAVEDEAGVRSWLGAPDLSLSESETLVLEVPRARGSLRVVALRATVRLQGLPAGMDPSMPTSKTLGQVGLALHDVRVVDRAAGVTSRDEAQEVAQSTGTPVDLGSPDWQGSATVDGSHRAVATGSKATVPSPSSLPAGALVVDGSFDMAALSDTTGLLLARTWTTPGAARVVITRDLARQANIRDGATVALRAGDAEVTATVQAVSPHLPGLPRGSALLADRGVLADLVAEAGGTDPLVDGWWLTASDEDAPALATDIAGVTGASVTVRVAEREAAVGGPLSVAVPAALSLITGATGVLVLVGMGASAAAAVRSRRLELARLQALGASRRSLVGGIVGEHTLLVTLGAGAGLAIGYGLARVVAPILTVSADGRRPVPAPVLVWEPAATLTLTAGLALIACAVVALLAAALVRRASGALLRLGDDR